MRVVKAWKGQCWSLERVLQKTPEHWAHRFYLFCILLSGFNLHWNLHFHLPDMGTSWGYLCLAVLRTSRFNPLFFCVFGSTEAFTTKKQQPRQIQTPHSSSFSKHTDPAAACSTPSAAPRAAAGPVISLPVRLFSTLNAPFISALVHALSKSVFRVGLMTPSSLLQAKGLQWHIRIWLICTEVYRGFTV